MGDEVDDAEVQHDVDPDDAEENESSDEDGPPNRRSNRIRKAVQRFTYDRVGGNPTYS